MGSSKSIEWKGYTVDGTVRSDFVIKHMTCDQLGRLTGHGKDSQHGSYTIVGFVSETGFFTFQKHYSKAKLNNELNPVFKGQFQQGFVSGTYQTPGKSNSFFLKMTHAMPFFGTYQRTDIPYPLTTHLHLQVDKNIGVFGLGCDHNGFFIAKGQKQKDDAESKKGKYTKYFFVVAYLGKFEIQHHSCAKIQTGITTLSGFWLNDSLRLRGIFELTQVQPTHLPGSNQVFSTAGTNQVGQDQMLMKSMFGGLAFNAQEYRPVQTTNQTPYTQAPQSFAAPHDNHNPFADGNFNASPTGPLAYGIGSQPVNPNFGSFTPNNKHN